MTSDDLRDRLAALTPRQRADLLARLRGTETPAGVPRHPFPADAVPLSSSQQRMLFSQSLDPSSRNLHTISGVARVPAALDPERLRDALNRLVARHEVLRTTFHLVEGRFVGRVHETMTPSLEIVAGLDPKEVATTVAANAARSFDPEVGPLVHVWVHDEGPVGFTMQLTMSHLVSDGFSNGILFEEVSKLYGLRGQVELEPLAAQFADYAHHAQSTGGDHLAWWSDRLRSAPPTSELPFDHPVASNPDHASARVQLTMPTAMLARLRERSTEWGTTPFVVLLSALATVLARWADQEEVVIGTPVANRGAPGATKLIGPFLNTIAMRCVLRAGQGFRGLVEELRAESLSALAHESCPFEQVVEALKPERVTGHPPLCQTMLNVQADRTTASGLAGITMQEVSSGVTEPPLSMTWILGDDAVGHVDHWRAVYDDATIADFVTAFFSVLRAGLENPEVPTEALPLTENSRAEALIRGDDLPRPLDAAGRFEAPIATILGLAAENPDAEMLVDGVRRLTRRDVAEASAAVAERLRAEGIRPGDRVIVALPRSAEYVISCLGAARAGATFVPVDVTQPQARLEMILQDCTPTAVMSQAGAAELPASAGRWSFVEWKFDELDATDPWADPTLENQTMYIIYTSGSTGTPKGVMVGADGLNNTLAVVEYLRGGGEGMRTLVAASPAFDMSILEVWGTLVNGGAVIIAPDEAAKDSRRLAALLERERITLLHLAPASLQGLRYIEWAGREGLTLMSGGDILPEPVAAWAHPRVAALWNGFGPTENTIWSHGHRVGPEDMGGPIPIGRPSGNTTNLVLDAGGHPVPPGCPGELWIGGESVAQGYLRRPELTAERFRDLPEGRFYRTGDKVRVTRDGIAHFLGRMDQQVKVRGYRIELGEIEAALLTVRGVADAAVVAAGSDADRRLVAFVEPSCDHTEATLVAEMAKRLPAYMVPTQWVLADVLPRTVAGKIDRRSLLTRVPAPAAAGDTPRQSASVHEPRTEQERSLLAIWREVLGHPALGMDDDFFASGGHSILATQLLFKVKQAFGVDIPLQLLFSREATAGEMAAFLAEVDTGETEELGLELDLAAEVVLAEDVRIEPGAVVHSGRHPQHPFVTGGTGFIGCFLIARLLDAGAARVFALVRVPGRREGMRRLRSTLEHYRLWKDDYADRIIPVVGDLAQPRLGLDRPSWDHLAMVTDAIYHSGADVNFVRPYATLKAANVLATADILRLAGQFSVKPVHYMSTIYVYDRFSHPPNTLYTEDLPPLQGLEHTFGYSQSKWVAEQLVFRAAERGFPVTVFRLGRVSGAVDTGISPSYDLLWRSAQVGIAMEAVPVVPMAVDMTPVDWVADTIVHISRKPESHGRAFHVLNPVVLPEASFVEMSEQYGYEVEHLTFAQWRERVIERAADLSDETAGALAPFLTGALPLDEWPEGDVDCSNVEAGLAGSGIECRPVDSALVASYYDYFVAAGVMPPPATPRKEPQP